MVSSTPEANSIAVIGFSGRFPKASNINKFWNNLCNGKDCITRETKEKSNYVKSFGKLDDIDRFDASFFKMSPSEASITDPQHRIFLELCWEALEHSGCIPSKYEGKIGVMASAGSSFYLINHVLKDDLHLSISDSKELLSNGIDYLATKVSYKLNLKGPSISMQSACSSSLTTVSLACTQLLTYQADVMLVGAISIILPQEGYEYQRELIFSETGYCRPFDENADGTVPSNAGGVVVLKRLDEAIRDNDTIYAVIKGFGINNDGGDKKSFSSPSFSGQVEVIDAALEMSEVHPETISFVECHGTGTKLGDPIEIKALDTAYKKHTKKNGFCAIGSVKGNIGHPMEASGIIGLLKCILSLHYKKYPKTINLTKANSKIKIQETPFYLNSSTLDLSNKNIIRCGLSSFGMGGTNVHLILENYVDPIKNKNEIPSAFLYSANSQHSLNQQQKEVSQFYKTNHPKIVAQDIGYTLYEGREEFNYKNFDIAYNGKITSFGPIINRSQPEAIEFVLNDLKKINKKELIALYDLNPNLKRIIRSKIELIHKFLDFPIQNLFSDDKFTVKIDFQRKRIITFFIHLVLLEFFNEINLLPDEISCNNTGNISLNVASGNISIEDGIALINKKGLDIKNIESLTHFKKTTKVTHFNKKNSNDSFCVKFFSKTNKTENVLYNCLKLQSDEEFPLLKIMGIAWRKGLKIDWSKCFASTNKKKIALPTYFFEKKSYWISSNQQKQDNKDLKKECIHNGFEGISSITNIFETLLQNKRVNPNEDFFKMGGDSLIAVELIAMVEEQLHVSLTLDDIAENPTPIKLATLIEEKILNSEKLKVNNIISLKKGNSQHPSLFFIHQIDGKIIYYKQLAQALEFEGNIFGIKSALLSSFQENHSVTIEQLAKIYINEINELTNLKNIILCGASFGGILALEIARQLLLDDVILIDTQLPDTNFYSCRSIDERFSSLVKLNGNIKKRPSDPIRHYFKLNGLNGISECEKSKIIKVINAHWNQLIKYKLPKFNGTCQFFHTKELNENTIKEWKSICKNLHFHKIQGNHFTMLKPLNLRSFSNKLNVVLAQISKEA